MKFKFPITALLVLLSIALNSCEKKPTATIPKVKSAGLNNRIPVRVSAIRDGETFQIEIDGLPKEYLSDLYFVRVSDPKIKGVIYSRADWRSSKTSPLSQEDAESAMNQVELSLREYYGDEALAQIIADRKKIINMSVEEMFKNMQDLNYRDKLDALYALDMINEFRQYLKGRPK